MKIPAIEGIIDRRILINFTIDKEVLTKFLPKPFSPQLVNGKGLAGICLIRLKDIRPVWLPAFIGINSENAAHRVAVEWIEKGKTKQGVYIPRRDTSSLLNHWAGGRIFPGVHHRAKFDVNEYADSYKLNIVGDDNNVISISATQAKEFDPKSVFENLETASDFFRNGSIGFSPNKSNYDGLELKAITWKVEPLLVDRVKSSFFENEKVFPKGSVQFDNALLMRNIQHKWNSYQRS
jgi:Uncharacterized conserved protein (COG2071)